MLENWEAFEIKMTKANINKASINAFKHNYVQLIQGVSGMILESDIKPIDNLPCLWNIEKNDTINKNALLNSTVVLKLNGGLGTSMGLEKAKSLLIVKDGKTFLDLIVEQINDTSNVVFILMNSFNTSVDTKKHLNLLNKPFIELMQNKSPKVDAITLLPASYPEAPDMEWCPPGHGDIYSSLLDSDLLDKLINAGIKYLFVSNSDNLGATIDIDILSYFAISGKSFMMEVCERTDADKKGGHLARRCLDNKLILRESAMCLDEDKPMFEDINKHKYFNTNNIWLDLVQLKNKLDTNNGILELPLIINKKTINPRDSKSRAVFQLETAMGSAIECFDNTSAIVVPRTRFIPIKSCNDLFVLRSDLYKINSSGKVEPVIDKIPDIKLDDRYYKLIEQFEELVIHVPSLLEATSLTVKGPIRFGENVVIKGIIVLSNDSNEVVTIRNKTYESGFYKVN
jgi:UDP-N-acetylglucosamine pyrophosphorylase